MTRRRLGTRIAGRHGALVTDLHLPDADGPAPAIVVRTPYGRTRFHDRGGWWAARGWAFVVQDVAGRHDSDGPWEPYAHERVDGAATVDAVRDAPWCDGVVVAAGASYSAFCAWQAAIERPSAVAAVVSEVPAMGPPRTNRERGSVPRLGDHVAWWLRHGEERTSRPDDQVDALLRDAGEDALLAAPAAAIPERLGVRAPRFADALRAPAGPDTPTVPELAALPMPTLHVAGWFDLFLADASALWVAAGSQRRPRPAGELVVGPWGHALDGPERHARTSAWLEAHVGGPAGAPPTSTRAPRRRWLPIGATAWRTDDAAPAAAAVAFRLSATGLVPAGSSAEAVDGGGPGDDWITHDPERPVRSVDPAADRRTLDGPPGAFRRRRTEAWPRGAELDGVATLDATVVADPAPTDWVAHLELVHPNGSIVSLARVAAATTSSPAPLHLEFPLVGAVVPPGGAIGLTLSASDHPDLLMPARTGHEPVAAAVRRPGRQRIAIDPETPALLRLPLRPTGEPR